MRFNPPLIPARLIRRYKRFLADVEFPDGRHTTVHCPNTGAMLGCATQGMDIRLSTATNPDRKYSLTWELVQALPEVWVGIHTGRSNGLVREAIQDGTLGELSGYQVLQAEMVMSKGFRVDFKLSGHGQKPDCCLEVKNVTAAVQDGVALFPDAVSERAKRHLHELMARVKAGDRAMLCFCVQRDDVTEVRPADAIDPVYGRSFRAALDAGVEVAAYAARVSPMEIQLYRRVPVVLP